MSSDRSIKGSRPPSRPESRLLAQALQAPGPRCIQLHGPEGTGRTALAAGVLGALPADRRRLHLGLPPLEETVLVEMIEGEARSVLGGLPTPERPDLLPLAGLGARWARLLEGILQALAGDGDRNPGGVLVLDGFDHLVDARRRLPGELDEIWHRIVRRGDRVHLVLIGSGDASPDPLPVDETIAVGALPFRRAGWSQGADDPLDAFRRWAIFGDHAEHLPRGAWAGGSARSAGPRAGEPAPGSLARAVIDRVLDPAGDLHDAPLRRLRAQVSAPARYAGILSAVADRDRDWSGMAEALGGGAGSRLAPYVQRLEAGGRLRVRQPLDAPPGSRRRRYAPVDPFDSFWFGLVLPVRNRLLREDPRVVWSDGIEPRLHGHFGRWLTEAGRRWLRDHAPEQLPAPARDAGAVWGDGVEFEIAGRLANGQICYGAVQPTPGSAEAEPLLELVDRMGRTRWGIGRQARAPILFLMGEPTAGLRREAARIPLAELITPARLMGEGV